jgi:hypothetical protein
MDNSNLFESISIWVKLTGSHRAPAHRTSKHVESQNSKTNKTNTDGNGNGNENGCGRISVGNDNNQTPDWLDKHRHPELPTTSASILVKLQDRRGPVTTTIHGAGEDTRSSF